MHEHLELQSAVMIYSRDDCSAFFLDPMIRKKISSQGRTLRARRGLNLNANTVFIAPFSTNLGWRPKAKGKHGQASLTATTEGRFPHSFKFPFSRKNGQIVIVVTTVQSGASTGCASGRLVLPQSETTREKGRCARPLSQLRDYRNETPELALKHTAGVMSHSE